MMVSVRQQWLGVLIFIAVLSVAVNALVLSALINRYFVEYTTKNYEAHVEQITTYSKRILEESNTNRTQMAMDMETHLSDPITSIKLYDAQGGLLIDVARELRLGPDMMREGMMSRMMGSFFEEMDYIEIEDDLGMKIGQLNILRYSSLENSMATRMFRVALFTNSLISIGLVLILSVVIGLIVSKKMSRDLTDTSVLAQKIDIGEDLEIQSSKVMEIRIIQERLEALRSKLKLKQRSRKNLTDALLHQTRTPLTILKSHFEGYEDGLIHFSKDELKTCENQIEDLTAIIENMSGMIDADQDMDKVRVEEFDLHTMLTRIVKGLSVQFERKAIALILNNHRKIKMKTDPYMLSQAIYNILTNAYKYTNAKGQVILDYQEKEESINITIKDDGMGIEKEELSYIFNAYYRGSNAKGTQGEGIGLHVVNENIKGIEGTVAVTSILGEGTEFDIWIPKEI
ncbi:sensor histidine kinase [Petrocella sp. FN5]|uniref:sensor histidine kinase n=1 Tax=Petrocella sp. FN5 TaxID=3032002 RepID=UPI0023DC94C2|nr:HAMP domain-containing sensor histidine kinase [Petrocella sp. FN5]MDF1616089.1 HAMP domain-containing sensor histidine kinase [Petrocella sp. FN5]